MPNRIKDQDPVYGTRLSPQKEKEYQAWRNKLPKSLQYEGNYDLRGLWNENPNVRPSANLHFPDTYKLPNHPTFSNESKYFNKNNEHMAGRWEETDSSFNYIPYSPSVKDTVVELKDKPIKKALSPDSDQAVIDWTKGYIGSPKYRERLAAFYKYPEYIQRQRGDIINTMKVTDNSGTHSKYWESDNEIRVSPLQVNTLNALRPEVVAHEMGHAFNWSGNNKAASLSPAEAKFILERNKNVSKSRSEEILKSSKDTNKTIQDYLPDFAHDINPAESASDIQALRFLLNRRGIYDAGKADVTPEILQKAKKDPVLKRSFSFKRLLDNFNDEQLIEIMNKVATNTTNNKSNMA